MLQSNSYVQEVQQDQYEAQQLGINGVPFFVFNNTYGVSGAQPTKVFTEVLEKVAEEEKSAVEDISGFCTPDGVCN